MAKCRFLVYADEFHDESKHIFQQIIEAHDKYSHTTIVHEVIHGNQSMGLSATLGFDPSSINAIDDCGCTPLRWAVWVNDVDAVRLLLPWKADHGINDLEERPTLAIAASRASMECPKY
ncbi:hypothetical protein S7711_01262 [Stachybotrys chartarum IBT 7711]|uniref:Uncharacterized protein n=1 Tax=Stachybotrys chartarum (strain CBS 109288 / IBT 7711) TaxID=1280523 RepID=A0A084BBH4_STACB|nr:hypothetical protein S7711_01262 [Stachybotrys chartarum IBT 7711]KFA53568.1 hypothetical protein S40293_09248 [Stachybotrys chartarum IBT 40293]